MDVAKMDAGELHYVDIHEIKSGYNNAVGTGTSRGGIPRGRKGERGRFGRQVSLETGFQALNESEQGRKVLARSGQSFGGFEAATGGRLVAGRKGDFDLFRTKSGLSKQDSTVKETIDSIRINEGSIEMDDSVEGGGSVPAGRYFAALRGPELDQIRESEDLLLPMNEKWPFLLRFPIGCFGICLGLSSQAVLWHALAASPITKVLHITPYINLSLWALASMVLIAVSATYILKCIFYFEAVRREYFHPVRINFFFAPWVVCMFLAIGTPPTVVTGPLHPIVWCMLMAPYFLLELKIYGQWLSGGKRRLCKVANPSSHLSVVGNFVGAILAAKVGWKEPAKFFWAIGFAHYLVLFVTLYQRLPTSEALPKELHPVYSMFIAAPSAASIAWEAIYGEFDGLARTCYFIALFLYASLVVRINFFTGFKFSVAWWSYTFPMTTVSVATLKYAEHEPSVITKVLALMLSSMSSMMVAVLCVCTLLHAIVWRTLFPNDLAIAITKKRQGKEKKPAKIRNIKRWTKQTPLSIVSSLRKQGSEQNKYKEDGEMRLSNGSSGHILLSNYLFTQ